MSPRPTREIPAGSHGGGTPAPGARPPSSREIQSVHVMRYYRMASQLIHRFDLAAYWDRKIREAELRNAARAVAEESERELIEQSGIFDKNPFMPPDRPETERPAEDVKPGEPSGQDATG